MGKWVQMSKHHPDVASENEWVNVTELGPKEGDQIVQGEHFYTADSTDGALNLAKFLRTEASIKLSDADELLRENIKTRIRDGYVHLRYLSFGTSTFRYVGKWDERVGDFVL